MKKLGWFSLLILLFLGLSETAFAKEKTLVVATAGDIKPFAFEQKKKLTGYDIEVLRAAEKYMDGYHFSFKKTSWESIFIGLDSEHYQVAANNLSYTKERAKKYGYSLPIASNPLVLVVPKKSTITSLDAIGGKTTQDDTGTSTAKLIGKWNQNHKHQPSKIVYSGEDVAKRLLDLENGEFDYLVFDKISVETLIAQKGLDLKVIALDNEENPNNYIIFSDASKSAKKQFNKALKQLYQTGTLKRLSKKYLGGSYLPKSETFK